MEKGGVCVCVNFLNFSHITMYNGWSLLDSYNSKIWGFLKNIFVIIYIQSFVGKFSNLSFLQLKGNVLPVKGEISIL